MSRPAPIDEATPTPHTRFHFVVHMKEPFAGATPLASALLRGVWEGDLVAADFELSLERIEEGDDAR